MFSKKYYLCNNNQIPIFKMKATNHLLKVLTIITFVSNSVFAIPADNTLIHSKKQSNGKIISYTLNGDEFIYWAKSLDGYTLLEKNNGDIVYAINDKDGKLIKSNVLACDYQYRTIEDNIFLNSIQKELFYHSSQIEIFKQNRFQRYSNYPIHYTPVTGTPNFLVILVSFADIAFDSTNATTMQNQISQSNYTANGVTGSVRDYFYDNSMGTLNANFTVVGPYTLSHNQAYYGAEIGSEHDIRPLEMITEACSLANNDINFANFDNDNNGYIDMIHVVYAGRGESNGGGTNAIWPHSWTIPNSPNYDGVYAYKYSCSNELNSTNTVDGIGTICHEMGHVLGLPDFYDTDYEESGGEAVHLSTWDLMASGNYNNFSKTPPYLSALERQMLGWLNPIVLPINITESFSVHTLPAISDSNKAYKITLSENEFFMIEHRNKKKWDSYTPAKGMLVFHGDNNLINPWITSGINRINVNPNDRGYFIIPAYGNQVNSTATAFPGFYNQTSFINSTLKNGTPTNKAIENISYGADSVISFTYINNINNVSWPQIILLPPSNFSATSVTLNGSVSDSNINSMGFEYRLLGEANYIRQTAPNSTPLQLTINNLVANSMYEYRGFVNSVLGTRYSSSDVFMTDCEVILNPPFSESFESTLDCWSQNASGSEILFATSYGFSPTCSPHSGNKMLEYRSSYAPINDWTELYSPKINFPHHHYNISLWIYRTNNTQSDQEEGVEIYISPYRFFLDSATLIGFISNDRMANPSMSNDGWYKYTCNLPSNITGGQYIIFKAKSRNGNNIYIDDFSIELSQNAPPTLFYNSTSNVTHNSATFNASYIQGGSLVTSAGFKYKSNNDINWTTVYSTNTSTPFTSTINNLAPENNYSVKSFIITQTNSLYESAIDTFTTQPLPIIKGAVITLPAQIISDSIKLLGELLHTGNATENIEIGFVVSPNSNPLIGGSTTQKYISTFTPDVTSFSVNIENPCNAYQAYYFKAFITNQAGAGYGDEITIPCLSIKETDDLDPIRIQLYPNPTNSTSNLKIENVHGNIKIRITDVSGRVLQEIEENVNNGYETQIDLSNYSKGTYFINIITDKSQKTEKLILK